MLFVSFVVGSSHAPPLVADGNDHDAWEAEYQACVRTESFGFAAGCDLVTHGEPNFFPDSLDPARALFEEFCP